MVKIYVLRGFTLVEVLVCLGIIITVIAISFPIIGNARDSALISKSKSNLHQIHLALSIYRSDHDGSGRYGSMYDMGLPPDFRNMAKSQKLGMGIFIAPGRPLKNTTFGARYMIMWNPDDSVTQKPWSPYTLTFGSQSIMVIDESMNFSGNTIVNPSLKHRGIGLYEDGSIRTRIDYGFMRTRTWWNN